MPKSALITGAMGNLGQAIVKQLRGEGYHIIATAKPGEQNPFSQEPAMFVKAIDLLEEEFCEQFIYDTLYSYPELDLAVLTVGGFAMGSIAETDLHQIQRLIQLNFSTAYNISRPLIEKWKEKNGGQIIFIGAKPFFEADGAAKMVAYTLSKSLLFELAEIINEDGKKYNIQASVIVPSIIDTPVNRKAMPEADPDQWVKPEAIAKAVSFLTSDSGRTLRQTVFKMYKDS